MPWGHCYIITQDNNLNSYWIINDNLNGFQCALFIHIGKYIINLKSTWQKFLWFFNAFVLGVRKNNRNKLFKMTHSQNVCILFQRQSSEVLCLFPFVVPHRQVAGKHSGEGRLKRAAVTMNQELQQTLLCFTLALGNEMFIFEYYIHCILHVLFFTIFYK